MLNKRYALDLFSGTGSATKYFRESDNWEVIGYDISPDREEDIEIDILDLSPDQIEKDIDFVWASPPCKSFSVANIYNNWSKKNNELRLPKSNKALNGVRLVYKTLYIIECLKPEYWFMENPRGGMRKIIGEPQHDKRKPNMSDKDNAGTITYCQYGDNRMKPTDLWGSHPHSFEYRYCGNGMDCHQSAKRGSNAGTQGRKKGSDRWRVPDGLAREVFIAVDNAVGGGGSYE